MSWSFADSNDTIHGFLSSQIRTDILWFCLDTLKILDLIRSKILFIQDDGL